MVAEAFIGCGKYGSASNKKAAQTAERLPIRVFDTTRAIASCEDAEICFASDRIN